MTALIKLCFGKMKASKMNICLSANKCLSIAICRNSWYINQFDFSSSVVVSFILSFFSPSLSSFFTSFTLVMASTFVIQGKLAGIYIRHGCTTILNS